MGHPNIKKRLAQAVVEAAAFIKSCNGVDVNKTQLCRRYLQANAVPPTAQNLEAARRQLNRVVQERPGHTALTPRQELILVGIVSGISCATQPVSKARIREIAERVHGPKFGPVWVNAFLKRHKKHLSLRVCKPSENARKSPLLLEEVEANYRFMECLRGLPLLRR